MIGGKSFAVADMRRLNLSGVRLFCFRNGTKRGGKEDR